MVELTPYRCAWPMAFEDEATAIRAAVAPALADLHHIGSTAVPGMLAKPIIDMLGVAPSLADIDRAAPALTALGYESMGAFGIAGRRYFRKIDAHGRRTHHFHVFAVGSPHIVRDLAFRDYLRAHRDVASDYAGVKVRAAGGQAPGWDSYQDAKGPFVAETERAALDWYRCQN